MIAGALMLGACSSDNAAEVDPTSAVSSSDATTTSSAAKSTSTTSAATTSTSIAATTTTVATAATLQPVAQQLIDSYDAAASAILADPRVASDPSHASVTAYLALFPDGSSFASGTVEFWAQQGVAGRFYRPGPRGAMYKTTVRSVEVRGSTEAVAQVCTDVSIEVVDSSGGPIESQGGVNGGEVTLVLVGNKWLLQDLTRTSGSDCPVPGSTP